MATITPTYQMAPGGPRVAATNIVTNAPKAPITPNTNKPVTYNLMNQTVKVDPKTGKVLNAAPSVFGAKAALSDLADKQNVASNLNQGIANQAQVNNQNQVNATATDNANKQVMVSTNATMANTQALNNAASALTNPAAVSDQGAVDQMASLPSGGQQTTLTPGEQQSGQTYQGISDQMDQATQTYNDAVTKLNNGTFPLTPAQQAQMSATQNMYNDMVKQIQDSYQGTIAGTGVANQRLGLSQYAPLVALGNIQSVMNEQTAKIQSTEVNAAKALSDLNSAFQTEDYKQIQDSYDQMTTAMDKKKALVDDLNTKIQSQLKDMQQQQKDDQTNARDALNTILTQLGGTAFTDLPPEGQAQLQQLEHQAGWPPGMMEQGMATLKEKQQQAADALAQQKFQDQQNQQNIQNSFKEMAMAISQQNLAISQQRADTAQQLADLKGSGTVLGLSNDDVNNFVNTLQDYNGQKYVTNSDLEGLSVADKNTYIKAAKAAGIKTLAPKDADAINTIQGAQSDLATFQTALQAAKIQPKDFWGRPISMAKAKLSDWLQTNNSTALDSFNATAIPMLAALKGVGTGGGGGGGALLYNKAIAFLPQKTDTVEIANQKIKDLNSLLDNTASSILPPVSQPAVPADKELVTSPTGQKGYIPKERLQDYLKQGYTQ